MRQNTWFVATSHNGKIEEFQAGEYTASKVEVLSQQGRAVVFERVGEDIGFFPTRAEAEVWMGAQPPKKTKGERALPVTTTIARHVEAKREIQFRWPLGSDVSASLEINARTIDSESVELLGKFLDIAMYALRRIADENARAAAQQQTPTTPREARGG